MFYTNCLSAPTVASNATYVNNKLTTWINLYKKTFQIESKFWSRDTKSSFAWCGVLGIAIFISFMISAGRSTMSSDLPKRSGVSQYSKVKFTSVSIKGDLRSLPPTREGVQNNTSTRTSGHSAFHLFLIKLLFRSLCVSSSSSCNISKKQNHTNSTWYVKLVSTTFSTDMFLKKFIHQFGPPRLNIDHQHSICWLRVEES